MSQVNAYVQLGDIAYRVVTVCRGTYEAVRILDEVHVGTFETIPRLSVHGADADAAVLRAIAMKVTRF